MAPSVLGAAGHTWRGKRIIEKSMRYTFCQVVIVYIVLIARPRPGRPECTNENIGTSQNRNIRRQYPGVVQRTAVNMDEAICPRCKTTKYRNPSMVLMVNTCGHTLCENCVETLFARGSGTCPECNISLRRNTFRIQQFEDPFVDKEVDIRKRILKIIVKKETSAEGKEELKQETLTVTVEEGEEPAKEEAPGARLMKLKETLQAKMRERRAQEREKRQQMYQLDNEEGFGDEEEEMTDEEETDDEEQDEERDQGQGILDLEAEEDGEGEEEDADTILTDELPSTTNLKPVKLCPGDSETDSSNVDFKTPAKFARPLHPFSAGSDKTMDLFDSTSESNLTTPGNSNHSIKSKQDSTKGLEVTPTGHSKPGQGKGFFSFSAIKQKKGLIRHESQGFPFDDSDQSLDGSAKGLKLQGDTSSVDLNTSMDLGASIPSHQPEKKVGFGQCEEYHDSSERQQSQLGAGLHISKDEELMEQLIEEEQAYLQHSRQELVQQERREKQRKMRQREELLRIQIHEGLMSDQKLVLDSSSDEEDIVVSRKQLQNLDDSDGEDSKLSIRKTPKTRRKAILEDSDEEDSSPPTEEGSTVEQSAAGGDNSDSSDGEDIQTNRIVNKSSSKKKRDEADGDEADGEEEDEDEEDEEKEDNLDDESNEELDFHRHFKGFMYKKKRKIRGEFVEQEAELSGSEEGSGDEAEGSDLDEYEHDTDPEDLPSDEEELQKQVHRLHMKSMLDEDKRKLRLYQEAYLEDGDLHSDSRRKRRFRWTNIDENSQTDLFTLNSDGEQEGGEEGEDDSQWRMARYQREKWLREKQESQHDSDDDHLDENSQFVKTAKKALSKMKKPALPSSPSKENQAKKTNTAAVSPGKPPILAKPMRVNRSVSQVVTPSAKRPRLDRSQSEDSNSIFTMLY
uniref:CDK-activating kinase assembly factor MAT1 n=1 Tax=Branchiostoma floridae TaxID=7739 RepID=C3Y0G6_BRAFL|eukprot:XP_002610229.1 hypothetical protein BRAFLDRAFT_130762 [Branchiostoma floridae]